MADRTLPLADGRPDVERDADPMIRLARWTSIVAHPFAVALALVAVLEGRGGWRDAAQGVAAVALCFVLPLAVLMRAQVRRGAWQTVDASRPRERPVLFLVGAGGLLALAGFFAATRPSSMLARGTVGVLALVAVCAVATRWSKVSLHAATAAFAAALVLSGGQWAGWLFLAAVPAVAWSRVALRRHSRLEVALGMVLGAAAGALVARAVL